MPIGLTILIGHRERIAHPVFDCRTRVIEVVELADWLKARGYEASACQWNQPNGMVPSPDYPRSRWQLITGRAELPPMPTAFPAGPDLTPEARADRDIGIKRRLAYARR